MPGQVCQSILSSFKELLRTWLMFLRYIFTWIILFFKCQLKLIDDLSVLSLILYLSIDCQRKFKPNAYGWISYDSVQQWTPQLNHKRVSLQCFE